MGEKRELRILSLDGGGIRGLSSVVILEHIMHRVGARMDPPNYDLQPWQYFDLIGGTSTGGIIALMLGRLRMSIEECKHAYYTLGQKVFKDPRGAPHEHMFDASHLEQAIKTIIEEKLGPDHVDDPLLDPLGKDCCKTVVYTLPYKQPNAVQPKALRTYKSKIEPEAQCTIWQAARATSAAPTFFAPLAMGTPPNITRWVDAGMKFNNPSKVLRSEAGRIWGDYRGYMDLNKEVACFLSIGTGKPTIFRLDAKTLSQRISKRFQVPLAAVEVIQSIATDTETVHTEMDADLSHELYHRFNVEQGLQEVQLFQYEELERIQQDTELYIQSQNRSMAACTEQMSQLAVKPSLLAHSDAQYDEVVGRDLGRGQSADEQLQARLDRLRIPWNVYRRSGKDFEKSASYEEQLHRFDTHPIPHLRTILLQADILEKQGRLIAKGVDQHPYLGTSQGSSSRSDGRGDDLTHVQRQMKAFERWQLAFMIYRVLFHVTERYWESTSLEHGWVMARIGGLLSVYGMRQEAALLLLKAGEIRQRELGPEHKSTKAVHQALEEIQQSLVSLV